MYLGTRYTGGIQDPFTPEQADVLTQPETRRVLKTYVDSAYEGVGTEYADDLADAMTEADKFGAKVTLEDFKSMGFADVGVQWYDGLTEEGAKLRADNNRVESERARVLSRATTGQHVFGFGGALLAGTFEEKNIKYGLAGTLLTGFGGVAVNAIRSARTATNVVKNANRAATLAKTAATEGFVSAALMEPSNRYSADILQQDYTMADTMFNLATSTIFSAAISAGPTFVKNKYADYQNRIKAREVALDEMELASTQALLGQKIDTSAVEHINASRAPISNADAMNYVIDNFPLLARERPEIIELHNGIQSKMDELAALEAEVKTLSGEVEAPEIAMVDPVVQERLAQIEAESQGNVSKKRRAELEQEAEMLKSGKLSEAESSAVEAVKEQAAKRLKTNEIKLKKATQALRKKQSELRRESSALMNQVKVQAETSATVAKKALEASFDPLNDKAFAGIVEPERLVEPKNVVDFHEKQFNSIMDELSDEDREFIMNAVDSYNEADIQEAYKHAYSCLTRDV